MMPPHRTKIASTVIIFNHLPLYMKKIFFFSFFFFFPYQQKLEKWFTSSLNMYSFYLLSVNEWPMGRKGIGTMNWGTTCLPDPFPNGLWCSFGPLSACQTTLFYWLDIVLSRPACCYCGQNLAFAINHKAWIYRLDEVFLGTSTSVG
jgi:hypothetical protein